MATSSQAAWTTADALPARALTAWRLASAALGLPLVAFALGAAALADGLPGAVRIALGVLPAVGLVVALLVVLPLRHRLWRYVVADEEIDLLHGWPVTTHTAVPMVRVQHVALQQGPLARRFSLASLRVNTAAGPVRIPSLDRADAERIRRRIAELARIADDL